MLAKNNKNYYVIMNSGEGMFTFKNASFSLLDRNQDDKNCVDRLVTLSSYFDPDLINALEDEILNDSVIYETPFSELFLYSNFYDYVFNTYGKHTDYYLDNPMSYVVDKSSMIPYRVIYKDGSNRYHLRNEVDLTVPFLITLDDMNNDMLVLNGYEYKVLTAPLKGEVSIIEAEKHNEMVESIKRRIK